MRGYNFIYISFFFISCVHQIKKTKNDEQKRSPVTHFYNHSSGEYDIISVKDSLLSDSINELYHKKIAMGVLDKEANWNVVAPISYSVKNDTAIFGILLNGPRDNIFSIKIIEKSADTITFKPYYEKFIDKSFDPEFHYIETRIVNVTGNKKKVVFKLRFE